MNNGNSGAWRKRVAPSVPLKLDLAEEGGGRLTLALELVFDFNAVAAVETATGRNVFAGDIWQNLSGTNLSVLFWAAVQARQPGLAGEEGLEIIRSYMDVGNSDQITWAIWEAFLVFLSKEARDRLRAATANPPQPAATLTMDANRPTGVISGPSPATISASAATNSAN